MEDTFLQYHHYLLQRSFQGTLYRKLFLYPRLSRLTQGRTLDIGCGIGDFLRFKTSSIGVDINPYNVDYCKNQNLPSHLMKDSELPFETESFDSVLLDNVLEHIENPTNLLEEIWRVLKPNGRAVVGVPGRKGYQADSDHKIFYDSDKLKKCLEAQDFVLESSHFFPMKSKFLDENLRQYTVFGVFKKGL